MNATIIAAATSLIGVLAVGVLIPLYLVSRSDRQRREDALEAARLHREDREAEWARQDEVAARLAASQRSIAGKAAEAAALLLARQQESAAAQQEVARQAAEAARLLAENNHLVTETAKETGKKLDTIHTLVNSSLTSALQDQYEAVGRELAMMKEVAELRRQMGQEPGPDVLSAIVATQAKLHELDAALADRARAQDRVNQQIGLDIITTTSYRQQDENAPASGAKTAAEVNTESQGAEPQQERAASSYQDEPPPGHGEDEGSR